MKTENLYSLDFDKSRQVRIKTDSSDNTEDIRLMANGIAYSHNCKSGEYAGCGIDAAHSFMGWFKDDIPRKAIKKKVETLDAPGDFPIPTTPAQMSVGLEKLVKQTVKNRKSLENNIIRHTKGSDASVIAKIRHHLRRGMPVVALINRGGHWVTLVGMTCKYTANNEIDVKNTSVTCIDLTNSVTYSTSYKSLKILHWSSSIGQAYASSYKSGTVISLKSDSILYGIKWKKGWNGSVYNVKGVNYLFLLKESDGSVHIHKMKNDGSVGGRIVTDDWSKGWSNVNFYTIDNQTYMFLMKAGSGSGYTSGLVHIHKMNNNGTVGKMIKEYDWSAGWSNIEFFSLKGKTYLLLNKLNGNAHIHEMKSDGTVKTPAVLTTKSFIKGAKNIQFVESGNEVYFYGIKSTSSEYAQYKFYKKSGKFKLELVEKRKWTKYWTDLNIFKTSSKKHSFIMYKGAQNNGVSLNGRNGIMHIHEIEDLKDGNFEGKLGKIVDDNYYRNSRNPYMSPTEMWSNIQYFRATNGKLKLFLLDRFSGRVRVINMQEDGAFEKQLSVSKPIKAYIFHIRTSSKKNAGTDARVFITLKGKDWVSPEYEIDTICNDFEKGRSVTHSIPVKKYFGEITKVIVRHDNSGNKPGWHLKDIKIYESTTISNNWKFVANQWLATSTGDGKIKRTLTVSS